MQKPPHLQAGQSPRVAVPPCPPAGKPHTPDVCPSLSHLPTFNTMAMFTVLPGKSFHAVQVRGSRVWGLGFRALLGKSFHAVQVRGAGP